MPLKHADIWQAIDRLAEANELSPSGLAIQAGLSPTAFNPSKRASKDRKHWPSTESIAQILHATGASFDEFVAMTRGEAAPPKIPVIALGPASKLGAFDDGRPAGRGWDDIRTPQIADSRAFALEVTGRSMEPVYRNGDRLILSPAEKARRGDRVVLRTVKGAIMAKELGRDSSQKIELIPLNPKDETITIPFSSIEWMYRIIWVSQ